MLQRDWNTDTERTKEEKGVREGGKKGERGEGRWGPRVLSVLPNTHALTHTSPEMQL